MGVGVLWCTSDGTSDGCRGNEGNSLVPPVPPTYTCPIDCTHPTCCPTCSLSSSLMGEGDMITGRLKEGLKSLGLNLDDEFV